MSGRDETTPFGASFGFESALTQLFRNVDPLKEVQSSKFGQINWTFLEHAASAHKRGHEAYISMVLPQEVSAAARNALFHERTHYWQLLFSSAMQQQTEIQFEQLRIGVKAAGGYPHGISSAAELESASRNSILREAVMWFQNFGIGGLRIFERRARIGDNTTFIGQVMYGLDPNTAMEGYYAYLGDEDRSNESVPFFPLVGRTLLESAAHTAERLGKGEPLSRQTCFHNKEDVIYHGAWELWCRVSGSRYESDVELATAFLGLVDLALNPELPDKRHIEYDLDDAVLVALGERPNADLDLPDWASISSISSRFGRAFLASISLPTLSLDGRPPADAVTKFQDYICSSLSWPTPTQVASQMAAYLTITLARLSERSVDDRILDIMARHPRDISLDDLAIIWDIINEHGLPDILGIQIRKAMVNAAVFRARNPGKAVLPHEYRDELNEKFPLPMILYEGDYYLEGTHGIHRSEPLALNHIEYWSDCIKWMTVGHLRYSGDRTGCGFVRRRLACQFMASGGGCPKLGLSTAEQTARREAHLDLEWCHWKAVAEWLGLIAGERHPESSKL